MDTVTAKVTVEPAKGFDLGDGPGRPVTREVKGGTVGLILDGRGRELQLPDDAGKRKAALAKWVDSIELYPELQGAD